MRSVAVEEAQALDQQLLLLPLWYVVFLLSLTCHEAAHAFAAQRGGDDTAYLGGQVSLNPIPHIRREVIGTVVVPLGAFLVAGWMMGWASAPYDSAWEDRHPRRAAMMALAGPLANLALAAMAFAALKVGLVLEVWGPQLTPLGDQVVYEFDRLVVPLSPTAPGWVDPLARICSIALSLNIVLFLFNMLPFPPMDGASVLAGISERARRLRDQLRSSPWAALVGLVLAWHLFGYIFWPLYTPVLRLLFG